MVDTSQGQQIKAYRGIDLGPLQYYIEYGKTRWNINAAGHTRTEKKKIKAAAAKYNQLVDKVQTRGIVTTIYDAIKAKISELTDEQKKQNQIALDKIAELIKEADSISQESLDDAHFESTKAILQVALPGFKVDEMADDPRVGEGMLHGMANELLIFLAEIGGKAEYQRYEKLSFAEK